MDESDEAHFGGGGELDAQFQSTFLQRLNWNAVAQIRVAVEMGVADVLQSLAAASFVTPVTSTLENDNQQITLKHLQPIKETVSTGLYEQIQMISQHQNSNG